jgi:cyclic-di-GMP-binding protein
MPSFDVVSKVESHELSNAVDQANREVTTRFDFKGTDAKFELKENTITLTAPSDFQLKQMIEMLQGKMVKRQIDIKSLDIKDPSTNLSEAKQEVHVKQGIDQGLAKKITKAIKESKLKVQAAIQGEQVRVTGKKRDDLQEAIAFLKDTSLDQPIQFDNFRD